MANSTVYETPNTAIADLETLKANYLNEFNRSIPKLKSLAESIRQHESELTDIEQIDQFWDISENPKINYELCQVAEVLDSLDEIWESHPNNFGHDPAPEPSKFNYKLWDNQAFSLSQNLWQIESIVGLAARAVDRDSELGDELHGGLMAIAELCKISQHSLEVHLMRPVEKQFKGN